MIGVGNAHVHDCALLHGEDTDALVVGLAARRGPGEVHRNGEVARARRAQAHSHAAPDAPAAPWSRRDVLRRAHRGARERVTLGGEDRHSQGCAREEAHHSEVELLVRLDPDLILPGRHAPGPDLDLEDRVAPFREEALHASNAVDELLVVLNHLRCPAEASQHLRGEDRLSVLVHQPHLDGRALAVGDLYPAITGADRHAVGALGLPREDAVAEALERDPVVNAGVEAGDAKAAVRVEFGLPSSEAVAVPQGPEILPGPRRRDTPGGLLVPLGEACDPPLDRTALLEGDEDALDLAACSAELSRELRSDEGLVADSILVLPDGLV